MTHEIFHVVIAFILLALPVFYMKQSIKQISDECANIIIQYSKVDTHGNADN